MAEEHTRHYASAPAFYPAVPADGHLGIEGRAPGPRLIFDGHLDVVPAGDGWATAPFSPVISDGRLIGRGAADMKGGVAAMIVAAEAVQRADVPLRGGLT